MEISAFVHALEYINSYFDGENYNLIIANSLVKCYNISKSITTFLNARAS